MPDDETTPLAEAAEALKDLSRRARNAQADIDRQGLGGAVQITHSAPEPSDQPDLSESRELSDSDGVWGPPRDIDERRVHTDTSLEACAVAAHMGASAFVCVNDSPVCGSLSSYDWKTLPDQAQRALLETCEDALRLWLTTYRPAGAQDLFAWYVNRLRKLGWRYGPLGTDDKQDPMIRAWTELTIDGRRYWHITAAVYAAIFSAA